MNRSVLTLLLPALLALLGPAAAGAGTFEIHHGTTWIPDPLYDLDESGDPTCGDRVGIGVHMGVDAPDRYDPTNLRVVIALPSQVTLDTERTFIADGQESDCTLIEGDSPGDTRIVAECAVLCSSGLPNCSQNGASINAPVFIDDPNTTSSFAFQAKATADQWDGVILGDDLSVPGNANPATFSYQPCPLVRPASLYATLADSLVADVDGDGLADPGDTLRYAVSVHDTGDELARGVEINIPQPAYGQLVTGSVTTPVGAGVVSGNRPGDTVVTVDLGTLDPAFAKSFTYDVRIVDLVPASVSQLSSQGLLDASNAAGTVTDDSDTRAFIDPTVTPLDFDPDLAITKTAVPSTVAAGNPLTWELTLTNLGRAGSGPVTLTETVPDHTTYDAGASAPGWSCTDGAVPGTACTLDLPPLAAGASTNADFAVRVDAALPAGAETTANTATVTDDGSAGPDTDPTNNTATATATLDASPRLTVTKAGPDSIRPGEILAYQLTYENIGTQAATGVELVETVPEHTLFVASASTPGWSCSDGDPAGTPCTLSRATVAAGAEATVAFAVRLAPTVPADLATITNRVTLRRDPGDDPPSGPDPGDDTETPVDAAVDLTLTKTGSDSARPGEVVLYELALANRGDRDAVAVTVEETVPPPARFDAGSSTAGWSCSDGAPAGTACRLDLTALPAGATDTATFALRLPATLPAGAETLTNAAAVRSPAPDANPGDNDDTATTTLDAAPDLVLTKDDGGATATPGGTVSYTLTVSNTGDQDATGIQLLDTLPEHADLVANASTGTWTCDTITPVGDDPPASLTQCRLDLADLAAGDTAPPLTVTLRVHDVDPSVTEIVNRASVTDDGTGGPDPNPADNQATETTPLDHGAPPPPPEPRLAATLVDTVLDDADGDGLPAGGDVVGYTAVVTNTGDAPATLVRLQLPPDPHTELIPEQTTSTHGTLTTGTTPGDEQIDAALGTLAPGDTATVTFEVRLAAPLPTGLDHIEAQGDLTSADAPNAVTDDPDTPTALDPTLTPLDDDAGGPGEPQPIPTVSDLGLALLVALFGVAAWRRLRRTPLPEARS